jgi:D-3-phosphoglycerate dehydrogenase
VARVLISDKLAEEGLEILRAAPGIEVDHRPGMDPAELREILPGYDALIVRSGTKVTADLLEVADKLRVVGRAGIGVDNVDLGAATARGVIVMNTPEGNAVTTAEHALALMMSVARHIPQAYSTLRDGQWAKGKFSGKELCNQVLGVVGLGNIGSIVADRARGLRMRVIAHDPLVSEERAERLGVRLVSFEDLLATADVITVHVPLTKETRGLIGSQAFAKMKRGVLLVNASRGGIVDEDALLEAIDSGIVAGAALDVFAQEPVPKDHPLLHRDQVVATPHLGAATAEAQLKVAVAVAEQVRDYLVEGVVRNAVNLPSISPEQLEEVRPFLVLGERLGRFQGQLAHRGIREIEVEYAGEIAKLDVQPVTLSVLKGLLEPWVGERVNYVNAPHLAQDRGIRVIETKATEPQDFVSLVTVHVKTPERERLVSGTIFGRTQPRIVRVDQFMLEAIPEGATLLIQNRDLPGVVGRVGSILGAAKINIARMQLGLLPDGNEALQLLNVDPIPPEEAVAALRALPEVTSVDLVELGPRVS